jgi:hypothetical protein
LGPGGDQVTTGSVNDTINFDKGDGQAIVNFGVVSNNGGKVDLRLGNDISESDVILSVGPDGDLSLSLRGDQSDSITFEDDLTIYVFNVVSQVGEITFGDGTVWDQAQIDTATSTGKVSESAAVVSATFDQLNADPTVTSITLTDSGTPTLTLSARQTLYDTTALGEITNPKYAIAVSDTAVEILENLAALTGTARVVSIGVADTAANISTYIDALNAAARIASITLSDAGTPTLTLAAAQALGDTIALGKITNANYAIAISDTAADILDNIAALTALAHVASIAVADTAANVAANLGALNAIGALTSITLTDAGTPTLTLSAAQALGDTVALGKIANANYAVAISDSASDVASDLDALNNDAHINAITLTDGGTPVLSLTAAEAEGGVKALSELTNPAVEVEVTDTPANVAALVLTLEDGDGGQTITLDASGNTASWTAGSSIVPGAVTVIAADGGATLTAGTGDDILVGGDAWNTGDNTYVYASTDGDLTIRDNRYWGIVASNTLELTDLDPDQVTFSRSGNDLIITVDATGNTITVPGNFDSANDNGIQEVQFADGTVWDRTEMTAADWYRAGAGNVTVTAEDGGATLVAGPGNDTLVGGDAYNTGDNTYVYASTDGDLTILDNRYWGIVATNTLELTDLDPSEVTFSRSANDLIITVNATGNTITVPGNFDSANDNGIQEVSFADGTSWDRAEMTAAAWYRAGAGNVTVTAEDGGATLVAGPGNDTLVGGDAYNTGDNTYVYASTDGDLTILDNRYWGIVASNTLELTDLDPGDVTFSRNVNDLIITVNTTGKTITVPGNFDSANDNGVQQVVFANGTSWDPDDMTAAASSGNVSLSAAFASSTIDILNANKAVTSIALTDSGTPTLTLSAAQALGDKTALLEIANSNYAIAIADTSANVAANFDALNANPLISSITMTDSGAPILALTTTQAENDILLLGDIANANYVVTYADPTTGVVQAADVFGAAGQLSIASGAVFLANGASVAINGSNDTITMSDNNNVVASGTGETYKFGSGAGQGEIGAAAGANSGTAQLWGVTDQNIWLQQVGDNLQVDLMGSNNQLTVDDWFGGSNPAAVQGFATSDGLKLDTQVAQLVSAMATYATDNPAFNPTAVSQIPTDSSLQSAVAAAWHH